MADAAKNLPRLPPDWIKRKFSDSSVERFLKWVIQKSAEINQQGEKAPLRAVAFLLSVGSYSVGTYSSSILCLNRRGPVLCSIFKNVHYISGSDNLRRRTYRHCMAGLLILPVMSNELRDSRLMFFEPANKECHFVPDWGKGQSEVELRVPFICGEVIFLPINLQTFFNIHEISFAKCSFVHTSDDESDWNRESWPGNWHSGPPLGVTSQLGTVCMAKFGIHCCSCPIWHVPLVRGCTRDIQGIRTYCENNNDPSQYTWYMLPPLLFIL